VDGAHHPRRYSTDSSKDGGGDIGYVTAGNARDAAWLKAVFALPTGGTTGVAVGADGACRIGRVIEIVPAALDPQYQQRVEQAMSLAVYREAVRDDLTRARLSDAIVASATTGNQDQVHLWEIGIDSASSSDVSGPEVRAAHILFAPRDKALSDAPDAAEGGDMGWVAALQLQVPPQVNATIFALKAGDVSAPQQQPAGTYMYLVTAIASRPVDARQKAALEAAAFDNWYAARKAAASITRFRYTTIAHAGRAMVCPVSPERPDGRRGGRDPARFTRRWGWPAARPPGCRPGWWIPARGTSRAPSHPTRDAPGGARAGIPCRFPARS
jgi:parvulin-like peptidyl-prolyl isomerase